MAKKPGITSNLLARGLSASLAGIRASGALAIDNALNKAMGKDSDESYSEFARSEAERFVQELGHLKGTYVKIGQMMALFGEHFLPGVLTQALHKLQDKTDPLDWEAMEPVVRKALGDKYDELEIEPNAIAAASLAQVHRATIKSSGEEICLKIQYPGLAQIIDREFDSIIRMMVVARWLKRGRELDEWIGSMREQLHNEIDYQREMALTLKMERFIKRSLLVRSLPGPIRVPEIHIEYSGDSIIAMEYIDGISPADIDASNLGMQRRNTLAKTMLELFFKEIFEWGLVQTDPNFGNYLVTLPDADDDHPDILTLLDFGSAIELTTEEKQQLRDVIAGGLAEDREQICRGLDGLGWLDADSADEAKKLFSGFCIQLLEPLQAPDQLPDDLLNDKGQYRWANSQLMQRVGKKGSAHSMSRHFTPPAGSFTLIARRLTGLFTFITVLDAEFNGHDIVQSYLNDE